MSIATAIAAAQQKVANAYNSVNTKGGTLPATQNLSNLPAAIESIPSGGGGGGDPIDVKASIATKTYTQNDKVTLIPSDTIYAQEPFSYDMTQYIYNSQSYDRTPGSYYGGYVSIDGLEISLNYSSSSGYINTRGYTSTFNQNVTEFSAVSTYRSYSDLPLNSYGYNLGARQAYNGNNKNYSALGVFNNGAFVPLYTSSVSVWNHFGPCIIAAGIFYYDGSTITKTISTTAVQYATKYNGEYYVVQGDSSSNTKVYEASTGSVVSGITIRNRVADRRFGITAIDDNGDYYIYRNIYNNFGTYAFKLNKSGSEWYEEDLEQASGVFASCFTGINEYDRVSSEFAPCYVAQTHDFGTYCDIFIASTTWGYNSSNNGNKVAHLRFTKATETMERLADVFYDVDDIVGVVSLSVNWEQGLIAIVGIVDSTKDKVYVKKLDSIAEVYPYTALTSDRGNYTKNAIVGFVDENKGTDLMGSTVLSVNTTEDPTKEPFSNIGKIIGMNVIIQEGEPS